MKSTKTRERLARAWRWSWLVTLPVCLAFAVWAAEPLRRFQTFGVRFDSQPFPVDLHTFGLEHYEATARRVRLALGLEGANTEDRAGLRKIELTVHPSNLRRLNGRLPHTGLEYVPAGLWNGTRRQAVNVRYRGDFLPHWGYEQKSWRVKTRGDEPFEGLRRFNLLVSKFPERLNNFLAYRLAQQMGLVAPRVEMVELVVNGRSRGPRLLCEQIDEDALLARGMPGDLYIGEMIGRDRYADTSNMIFDHPGLWQKLPESAIGEEDRGPLEQLIALVNSYPSDEVHAELSALLDMGVWGAFSAFETLSNSFHYDEVHNWRLYYDPARRRITPLVWDPMGWAGLNRNTPERPVHQEMLVSRLHALLFTNGDFLRARQAAFERFFAAGLDRTFLEEAAEVRERARAAVDADPAPRWFDARASQDAMDELLAIIEHTFTHVRSANLGDTLRLRHAPLRYEYDERSRAAGVLPITITGRGILDRVVLEFAEPPSDELTATVRLLREGAVVAADVTERTRVEGAVVAVELGLSADLLTRFPTHGGPLFNMLDKLHVKTYYEIALTGLPPGAQPLSVRFDQGSSLGRDAELVPALAPRDIERIYRVLPAGAPAD